MFCNLLFLCFVVVLCFFVWFVLILFQLELKDESFYVMWGILR